MITVLQQMARNTAALMGRESFVIRSIRPAYESLLDVVTAGRGVPWPVNGFTYRVDPHERNRFPHEYDPPVARLLRERVKPGAVCFDVGANAGIYVLQLAQWSQPNGRVVAFEPNAAARRILEKHAVLNGISERVSIVPCAVGRKSGQAMLFAASADGMSRLGEPNRALSGVAAPRMVTVATIDDYCDSAGLLPDALLIDIEGFEIAALAGAARTIRKCGSGLVIVVEMHPSVWASAGDDYSSATKVLHELRLRPVPLTGQVDPLDEYGQVLLEHC